MGMLNFLLSISILIISCSQIVVMSPRNTKATQQINSFNSFNKKRGFNFGKSKSTAKYPPLRSPGGEGPLEELIFGIFDLNATPFNLDPLPLEPEVLILEDEVAMVQNMEPEVAMVPNVEPEVIPVLILEQPQEEHIINTKKISMMKATIKGLKKVMRKKNKRLTKTSLKLKDSRSQRDSLRNKMFKPRKRLSLSPLEVNVVRNGVQNWE